MKVGEKIYSNRSKQTFTVIQAFKAGGQSEVCYASSDKSKTIFFLKRFLNIKYSDKPLLHDQCEAFENERNLIYGLINRYTLPGGSCSYVYDFFRERNFYYVATEKYDGFELCPDKLSKCWPIEDRLYLFRIIVFSFLPFERNKIIHGDVKPGNILIRYLDGRPVARNIDFESSFLENAPPPRGCIVGTEPYYSPELADYNSESDDGANIKLSTKSDVFSLGLILYELLTGHYPNVATKEYWYESCKRGVAIPMESFWSEKLKCLIVSMLDFVPEKRPSIEEIVGVLRNIDDVSINKIPLSAPIVKVEYLSPEKALVRLFNLSVNSKLFYSCDRSGYMEYSSPFFISKDDVLVKFKLIDISDGEGCEFQDMISVSRNRSVRCRRPRINIVSGVVTIDSVHEHSEIYYTIDGSSPVDNGMLYKGPFAVKGQVVVKAIVKKVGFIASDISMLNSESKVKIS